MSEYSGIFALLARVPMWATVFVALVVGMAIPFVIADRTSGLFFNFSYSGMIGDICLLTVVLIGATVIQREVPIPSWFAGMWPQIIWFAACIAVGVFLVTVATPWPIATWPDRYHNAVTVSLFLFLVPLMALAILYGGNRTETTVALLLIAIWGGLVVYDFKNDRMDQPARLERLFGLKLVNDRFEKP